VNREDGKSKGRTKRDVAAGGRKMSGYVMRSDDETWKTRDIAARQQEVGNNG